MTGSLILDMCARRPIPVACSTEALVPPPLWRLLAPSFVEKIRLPYHVVAQRDESNCIVGGTRPLCIRRPPPRHVHVVKHLCFTNIRDHQLPDSPRPLILVHSFLAFLFQHFRTHQPSIANSVLLPPACICLLVDHRVGVTVYLR